MNRGKVTIRATKRAAEIDVYTEDDQDKNAIDPIDKTTVCHGMLTYVC